MDTNYGLRILTDTDMERIPPMYRKAVAKLDNPTRCFLVANPDQCEKVVNGAFDKAREVHEVAEIVRRARADGKKWVEVVHVVRDVRGSLYSESTLRRYLSAP